MLRFCYCLRPGSGSHMHMPYGTRALTAARFVCKSCGLVFKKSQLCRIDTEERKSETTPWPPGPTLHRRPPILLFVKWHAARPRGRGERDVPSARSEWALVVRDTQRGERERERERQRERERERRLCHERRHLLSRQASSDDCSEGLSRFLPTKKQLAVKGGTRWCTLPLPRALADEDESIDARRVTPRPEHLQRKVPRKLMWKSGASATPPDRP